MDVYLVFVWVGVEVVVGLEKVCTLCTGLGQYLCHLDLDKSCTGPK